MWTSDIATLAEALVSLDGGKQPQWPFEDAAPPVKVLDCVLSLNRPYKSFVVPRVRRFLERCPDVLSCAQLRDRLTATTPSAFLLEATDVKDARRAQTLLGVTEHLLGAQEQFTERTEAARLAAWAEWARPGDYLAVGVPGFAIAGFQYLRMHFGSDTVKPDVHVVRYVSTIIGRQVTDVHALYLLEQAARRAKRSLRAIDGIIWERSARN